jgi:chemotaxis protein methyltransferase CheR
MKMTEDEFQRIYKFIKERYGIDMHNKKEIMQGRLENYVTRNGWKDFDAFMNAMEQDVSGQLEKRLLGMLTTNHTYFMREFEHFDFLRTVVLPELYKKESRTKDLAIWSGAASSGEEPYMLAMTLMDFFGLEHEAWDTTVLATDVSTEILQQAKEGIYTKEQIAALPMQWKRRYFRELPDGIHAQVRPEIKREILFRRFNLMDPFPFKRKFHVIFLRNVMIYFDNQTKEALVKKLYDSLEDGGYLFIGKTETIDRSTVPFHMIQPSIFRK